MAGGYSHDPKGVDSIVRVLRSLQRQIDEIRGSAGIKSAVIQGRIIEFRDEDGNTIVQVGETSQNTKGMSVIDSDGRSMLSVYEFDDGTGSVVVGDGVTNLDWFLVQGTETISLYADQTVSIGNSLAAVPTVRAYTDFFQATTPFVSLPTLITTSNAANVYIGTVSGEWTLARVTSSLRYKTDVGEADLNAAEILALTAHTWIDKGDAEAAGRPIAADPSEPDGPKKAYVPHRQIGFIAEEAWEHESLRQFVGVDADGEPDSFNYERFASVGLHAVCQQQQDEIDDLKSTVASMEARLEALEAAK